MLILTPDLEIPLIDDKDQDFNKLTLRERAEVACRTLDILTAAGADFTGEEPQDMAVARDVIRGNETLTANTIKKNQKHNESSKQFHPSVIRTTATHLHLHLLLILLHVVFRKHDPATRVCFLLLLCRR